MKWEDAYIRFAFLTWVSKFSKASIFSGLNMIEDISLNKKYWNICWITQEELEKNFEKYLEKAIPHPSPLPSSDTKVLKGDGDKRIKKRNKKMV